MLNVTNITVMDSTPNQHNNLAWFMPTFMAVFMTLFLLVSFALHHRRFRERYKRRELLEYYLELQVETGLRRIAAPTTSSSIRRDDIESTETSESNGPTLKKSMPRASIDAVFSIAFGQQVPESAKRKKRTKIRHSDSGVFQFFKPQHSSSVPLVGKPRTISEAVETSRHSLNTFVSNPLPPISPVPSPSKRRRSSLRDQPPAPSVQSSHESRTEKKPSTESSGAILLSAKNLPEVPWYEHARNEQTPV